MAVRDKRGALPMWAQYLREARSAKGFTQEQIEELTHGLIRQRTYSDVENGKLEPSQMRADRFHALMKVLGISPKKYVTDNHIHMDMTATQEIPRSAASSMEVQTTFATFPVLGSPSAGTGTPQPLEGETASIPLEDLKAVGANIKAIAVYKVNGDCLVSESVIRGGHILPGDKIAVDTRRPARAGDVVVAWDGVDEMLLVKRVREEGDHIVFYPARAGVPPVVRHNESSGKIIGPVVWRGGIFRG